MIRHGVAPFLECSSRGDKRFSAFHAHVERYGGRSIEDIYQGMKRFEDGSTGLGWQAAKGRRAVNQTECAAWYSHLWDQYIYENPELLAVLCAASGLSDVFGQLGHCCQATELWRIRGAALTLDLRRALCADIETLPNCFTLNVQGLYDETDMLFEISDQGRDDRQQLLAWFYHWRDTQTPLIGFNIVAFDYEVLHFIYNNPYATADEIYAFAMDIIRSNNRFGGNVYPSDRFVPIIDLFKIWHFDNRAKSTSLKALQVAMRSETVLECPLPLDKPVTREQIDRILIPYNRHDVRETKRFAHISMDAIKFRLGLDLKGDVVNWSDTKIGGKILEQRLGLDKYVETTRRDAIPLNDIIFPYIQFQHPEFRRVLDWMRGQTLTADELTESIKTKGVFTGVKATVGGLDFHFGTGGIHGSVEARRVAADEYCGIYDIDVEGLYPSIAIVNRLYPEHLGEAFVREYALLPAERKKHKKGTVENAALKLAANGTYGNSNNQYSVFYDPRFTMTITVNGQLLLCMLAEWLLRVPGLEILQINTDGVTYRCPRALQPLALQYQKIWERHTRLNLERVEYKRMWLRDVNSYIAEKLDGSLKTKGAYWFPRNFPDDITNAAPPAWHKDLSNLVSIRAAVEHMVTGVDIERFIYSHRDPFDFMLRAKVDRSSRLELGGKECQRIMRYYVAVNGAELKKISPPAGPIGTWKRRNGISDSLWHEVKREVGDAWDGRIHTANRSKYVTRETAIESGFKVADCSDARQFDWSNVNYDWYADQARRLVVA